MTDEIDQKRNNNKGFPNLFGLFVPIVGTENAQLYCFNCKRFWNNATSASNSYKAHMNTVHGFKSS